MINEIKKSKYKDGKYLIKCLLQDLEESKKLNLQAM